MTGAIPVSLIPVSRKNCTGLKFLDLTGLKFLDLQDNQLTGKCSIHHAGVTSKCREFVFAFAPPRHCRGEGVPGETFLPLAQRADATLLLSTTNIYIYIIY